MEAKIYAINDVSFRSLFGTNYDKTNRHYARLADTRTAVLPCLGYGLWGE